MFPLLWIVIPNYLTDWKEILYKIGRECCCAYEKETTGVIYVYELESKVLIVDCGILLIKVGES